MRRRGSLCVAVFYHKQEEDDEKIFKKEKIIS